MSTHVSHIARSPFLFPHALQTRENTTRENVTRENVTRKNVTRKNVTRELMTRCAHCLSRLPAQGRRPDRFVYFWSTSIPNHPPWLLLSRGGVRRQRRRCSLRSVLFACWASFLVSVRLDNRKRAIAARVSPHCRVLGYGSCRRLDLLRC